MREESASSGSCRLLPSSSSILADWENVPETLLLNSVIGFILFVLFSVMTRIAWSRSTSRSNNTEDSLDQGLISFLYGYRDPERWYVIPRFEFFCRKDSHHKHELDSTNIYVPPKLPLSNPIGLFAFGSLREDSKSLEDINSGQSKLSKTTALTSSSQAPSGSKTDLASRHQPARSNATGKEVGEPPVVNQESSSIASPSSISQTQFKTLKDIKGNIMNQGSDGTRPSSGEQTLMYPSILTAEQLQASYLSRKLNRFFSLFFRVTDADIIYAKGLDAYEYLLFQRHLIFIMFITNILCLGVIFPINWFAGVNRSSSFQRSTIKNVDVILYSFLHWAHIICSICIVIVTIRILNSYRDSIITKDETQLARRTLLIGNLPVGQRNRVKLIHILERYFSQSKVEAIQFVYDTSRLVHYQMQLDAIIAAKEYCLFYRRRHNQELMVNQAEVNKSQVCGGNCRLCSFFYVCCYHWSREAKQPGVEFYSQQEHHYRNKIKTACEELVSQPSEYAFVTFKSYRHAKMVMSELTRMKTEALNQNSRNIYNRSTKTVASRKSLDSNESTTTKTIKRAIGNPNVLVVNNTSISDPLDPTNNPHIRSIRSPIVKKSQLTKQATGPTQSSDEERSALQKLEGPLTWSIRYAPLPDNVSYSDLLRLATTSKYTTAFFQFLMIIIFIFFTTPNVLMSMVERMSVFNPSQEGYFEGPVIKYLSVLISIILTALLPVAIIEISKQIPYEDTASKNHSIMWKVYLFLVLMVIVLPSVGMSSAQAFINSPLDPLCLFPADNGAYFVNYVLSSVFLSTMLELIKPVDILSYCFILWTSRSSAEYEGGRQYIEREFSVGMQHTNVLLIFSVVMTYSISCPLIAPAGLLYLIVKHAVDHYHLFYVYYTKKVDKNLQNTIDLFVKIALLLMLLQTMVAIFIKTGTSSFALVSQVAFWVTLAVFIFNSFFDYTSRAILMNTKRTRYQREFCACFYLPRVIEDLLRSDSLPPSCVSRKV